MADTSTTGRRLLDAISGPSSKISLTAAASVATTGVGTVTRYAIQVALAQLLGAGGYGLYLTMRRWGEMLAMLPNRGYQNATVRFLPDYVEGRFWSLYRAMVRRATVLTLGGGFVLFLVSAVVAALAWDDYRFAAVLAMATVPAWAALRLTHAILGAQHHYLAAAIIDQIAQPWTMVALLLGGWGLGFAVDLNLVAVALLLSVIIAATVGAVIMRRNTPPAARPVRRGEPRDAKPPAVSAGPTTHVEAQEVAADEAADRDRERWRSAARHFMAHQLSAAVIGSADLLILAMFRPRAEVGLYGAATRIALLTRVINHGTDSIVAPRISASWARRNMRSLQRNVDKAIAVTVPPTMLMIGILILAKDPILGLMGSEFVDAGTVVVILLFGLAIQAFTGPCGNVVALTDNEQFNARVMMASAALLVVGCLVVASGGGMIAVAVVTTIVNTVWNLVLVVFARRKLGIRTYPHRGMVESLAIPEWFKLPGRS